MLQVNLSKPFTCGNWTSLLPPYVTSEPLYYHYMLQVVIEPLYYSLSPSPVAIEPLYYHHMLQVNLSKPFTCGNWTSLLPPYVTSEPL